MTLRVGLIGSTGHVGTVLDGIPLLKDVVLTAACKGSLDDDLGRIRDHDAFTCDTVEYETWEELLDGGDVDVVGICRPYSLNAEAAVAAAEAGVHIICEKPIATELADLDRVERAVAENGVRLTAMLGMRLSRPFQATRRAVESGAIGEPLLVTAQKSYKFGTRPDFYRDRATYGGTIPWVAIHAVDYARWVAGVEFTSVAAHHANLAHPDYPGCEDQGGILFRTANGGTAMVNFDYLRPESAFSHGDDRLRIAGSEGVVEVKDGAVELMRRGKAPESIDLDAIEPRDFLADFVAELRGEGTHIIGPDEAARVTRICLLAREAADTGTILQIP